MWSDKSGIEENLIKLENHFKNIVDEIDQLTQK